MKLFIAATVSIIFLGMLAAFADKQTKTAPPKVGDTAPDWTLQDAEEKDHTLKKLRGKVVFLIMGTGKIREETGKWAKAFQKDYQKQTKVTAYIIANLRSVPWFISKGFIRNRLKKDPPAVELLLDWKGEVHKRYQTEEKKPTLYLISQKGIIVFHRKADFEPEIHNELKKEINRLLATPDVK
ncbi:MAG: redoxin domain-containing protein [Candidatus Poribacteria bacterium]|nr:redoxin domain-containing protein [Candidatus Poribacteria bacterium]